VSPVIRHAVLYLSQPQDAAAALHMAAGRPVAFRALMAAVRAGIHRIAVPSIFRGSELERAIARTPSARAVTVWVRENADPPSEPLLLVPAAALMPARSVAALRECSATTVLAESRSDDAPLVAATCPAARSLWPRLAAGQPLGHGLEETIQNGAVTVRSAGGWYARVDSPEAASDAEALLYRELSSPVDTRLDARFHRPLSRPLTRLAVAWRLAPNYVTLGTLLVGLMAAWCFWQGSVRTAVVGLLLYAVSVVLDHTDGEVARVTLAESTVGAWFDVLVDTTVHALIVLALGVTAERVSGGGAAILGGIGATGVVASAALTKARPLPASAVGVGRVLHGLSNRNAFYAMLAGFILALAFVPSLLFVLMVVVAIGAHAFWVGQLACRATAQAHARTGQAAIHGKK
jgi:phosphatidylglycerophosphate synthase